MSAFIMSRVIESMRVLPDDSEWGCWDRYLGLACERGEIKMIRLDFSFSKNTINSTPEIADARLAAQSGAVLFHGVKSAKVLEQIMDAHLTFASNLTTAA
jgi:hypothetical protein